MEECCWQERGTNCIFPTSNGGRATRGSNKAQKDETEDGANKEEHKAQHDEGECQILDCGCQEEQPRTQEEWRATMAEAQLFQDTHDELGNCVAPELWHEPEDARPKCKCLPGCPHRPAKGNRILCTSHCEALVCRDCIGHRDPDICHWCYNVQVRKQKEEKGRTKDPRNEAALPTAAIRMHSHCDHEGFLVCEGCGDIFCRRCLGERLNGGGRQCGCQRKRAADETGHEPEAGSREPNCAPSKRSEGAKEEVTPLECKAAEASDTDTP